jgi:hypothetical protein
MARPERLELPTLGFEGRCSIQLSYGRVQAAERLARLQIATPPGQRKQGGLKGEGTARLTEIITTPKLPNLYRKNFAGQWEGQSRGQLTGSSLTILQPQGDFAADSLRI